MCKTVLVAHIIKHPVLGYLGLHQCWHPCSGHTAKCESHAQLLLSQNNVNANTATRTLGGKLLAGLIVINVAPWEGERYFKVV